MDSQTERFHRLVRAPADAQIVINPSQPLLDEIERLGSDPRRPRTAIARWVSKTWLENTHESIRNSPAPTLDAFHYEKEVMERPSHYPTDWGIDFIPHPTDLDDGWELDRLSTACYTSLTTPRPFDPHLHGDLSASTLGFGYHYLSESGFPDKYDIVNRRGGGGRGGFAMTTGATEGAYPTSILPQPTFNLGRLGFSDGGWNPEGLQWTNRPKRMSLTGLRNGWAHKVFFARSRRVMNRNLYGRLARDEATPRAPVVVINGMTNLQGVKSVSFTQSMNTPARMNIDINNTAGRRSGTIREGDVVQVYASPRHWANPPLVFTGFVSEVIESNTSLELIALDSLGYLTREVLDSPVGYYESDSATVIKDIISNSAYTPPIGRIMNESFVILPADMDFVGKTRLNAIQSILSIINSTPNLVVLKSDSHGYLIMERLREEGDTHRFNVVKVKNDSKGISVSVPAVGSARYPTKPIERVVREDFIADEHQAILVGETMLASQGASLARWVVEGIPERLDITVGDVMEFASRDAGLSGRHRVFDVKWTMDTNGTEMSLSVGRQAPDPLATLRVAAGLSN